MKKEHGMQLFLIISFALVVCGGYFGNIFISNINNESSDTELMPSTQKIIYPDLSVNTIYNNGVCSILISNKNMLYEFSPTSIEWNVVDSWLITKMETLRWIAARGGYFKTDGWELPSISDTPLLSDENSTIWTFIEKSQHATAGDFVDGSSSWLRIKRSRIYESVPVPYRDILLYQDGENTYLALEQNEKSNQWYILKLWGYGDWLEKEIDLFFQLMSSMANSDNIYNIISASVCWEQGVHVFHSSHPLWSTIESWPVYTIENLSLLVCKDISSDIITTGEPDDYFKKVVADSDIAKDCDIIETSDLWIRIKRNFIHNCYSSEYKDILIYKDNEDIILAYQTTEALDTWRLYKFLGYGEWLEKDLQLIARSLAF